MQTFINTHPGSPRIKDATLIIDQSRVKLEAKEYRGAKLYYNLSQFRAAAIAYATLLNNYPESTKGEEYKLMIVKSYYRFAKLSIEEKKVERYEQVINECNEFTDRFPDSKLRKEAEEFLNLSQTNIKKFNNEQIKTPA